MSEFTGRSKEQLKQFKMNMEAYKEGCADTLKIIEEFINELHFKTESLWIQKIAECEAEIDKHD